MTKNVICVGEYESADVAARLMARYNLGSLPVRRFDGSLSGMVTDRDLVVRCMAADTAPGGLVGLLTLADLSRVSDLSMEAGECLGEICAPVRHLD